MHYYKLTAVGVKAFNPPPNLGHDITSAADVVKGNDSESITLYNLL